MVVSWLLIVTVLAAALALFDGIRRLRGHHTNSVLAILELIFAGLMLLSIFVTLPTPFLSTFILAVALEVVLVLILIFRDTRSGGVATITVIALILNSIVVLIASGWLHIPGLG